MRFLSILTAIVVVGVLYLFVFERDWLRGFAGAAPQETEEVSPDTTGNTIAADAAADAASERAVPVVAIRSTASSVDGAVILRGRTEAVRQVDVRAETSGRIISDPLRKGAFIEKGDLMCELDPGTREIALSQAEASLLEAKTRVPEAEARLAEARARLNEAEINDNAASRLSQDGFASETRVAQTAAAVEAARAGVEAAKSGVESARSGIQAAEASVASANNELDRLEIRAPFDGLLETDSAEIGSLMQPGSLCATIIQLDPIKLVGFVPETRVDRVELGALAGAELASGKRVTGEVTFLSRSADPNTRTFRVDVTVPNKDLSIRDGQTAEIGIQADGEAAHLLPQSSLTLDDDGNLGVRLVENDTAIFAEVSVLRDTVDGVWVTGLGQQIDVIVVGQEFVIDGVAVEATYREDSQ